MRPPKPTSAELQLKQENDGLRTTILILKREIENKQGAVSRLEILLRERLTRIDQLYGLLERARQQNQKLDEENEHLAALIAADHRSQTHIDGELETP